MICEGCETTCGTPLSFGAHVAGGIVPMDEIDSSNPTSATSWAIHLTIQDMLVVVLCIVALVCIINAVTLVLVYSCGKLGGRKRRKRYHQVMEVNAKHGV